VSRLSLFPAQTSPARRLGVGKRLGKDTAGQMNQTGQRDISYHVTSFSAIKTRGRGRKSSAGEMRDVDFQGGCSLETGWASVCLWEMMSDFIPVAWVFFPHSFTC